MDGVELSGWQVAYNGSEPIAASTIDQFTEKFKHWGFKASSMLPYYSLAEYTLLVSGARVTEPGMLQHFDGKALAENRATPGTLCTKKLIASGSWVSPTEVVIVHPDTGKKLNEGEVGSILVIGPDKVKGYWNDTTATAVLFGCDTNGSKSGYLHTGDNGFIWKGRLFVTGRSKEIIVIRGRNLYPNDLEYVIQSALGKKSHLRSTAFSTMTNIGECLVVACEYPVTVKEPEEVARDIRLAIAKDTGVQAYAILLVYEGSLPRTSIGKLRHLEAAARYHRGELAEFYRYEITVSQ